MKKVEIKKDLEDLLAHLVIFKTKKQLKSHIFQIE